MLLVLLIAISLLAVPFMADVQKHGKDNILVRAGRDILEIPAISAVLSRTRVTASRTGELVLASGSVAMLLVVSYTLIRIAMMALQVFSNH
jgi:hypothetical protein